MSSLDVTSGEPADGPPWPNGDALGDLPPAREPRQRQRLHHRRVGDGHVPVEDVREDIREDTRVVTEREAREHAEVERLHQLEREPAARVEAAAARRRLALLARASVEFSASLDVHQTFERLARFVVPSLADWSAISVQDGDDALRRVAVAPASDGAQVPREQPDRIVEDETAAVLRSGRSRLVTEVPLPDRDVTVGAAARREAAEQRRVRSYICVPLMARGRILAVLTLVSTGPARRYTPADLALTEEVAYRAAIAADNARLYSEMRQALEQRDTFLSIASHELKTPLTSMKIIAQMTAKRLERAGMADKQHTMRMERAIERMERLVYDLVDAGQLQAGKLELRLASVDLAALCRKVVVEQTTVTARSIALELEMASLRVRADGERIKQVLHNLLSNALKYSREDTPVSVTLRREADEAVVAVRDYGLGIPVDALTQVFDPYYRVPGVAVQSGSGVGLGLGLYLARAIVERHEGRIWAERVQQGSLVSVALPLAHGA